VVARASSARARFRMRVENRTHWQTRDLRRFVTRIAQEVLTEVYRGEHRGIDVRFAHYSGRGTACSGHAYLGGSFAHIGVPKDAVDRVDLAHTLAHEFGHLSGLTHRDMAGGAMWQRVGDWRERYAWANALPLRRKPARRRLGTRERREIQHSRLVARLARWERRAKRAATAIRKLRRQIARLDALKRRADENAVS
jgi:hypothetical protein